MKKIIVTGGLGFIGSNLIEILLKKKNKVLNIDKITYASNFYNVKEFKKNKNYFFNKCDLNNFKKLNSIIKKFNPDVIFNLAAETHVDRSIDNPDSFVKSNILGTYNLLEIFKNFYKTKKKTRLIHISTDEVYGDILKGRSNENYPYKPSSPYAASKASSDHLVYSYYRTFKLPLIITNCSNNYGPRQHPEKLIPKIIFNLIHGKNLPLYGNGKNSREWIFVNDHCDALIKIWKNGKIGNFYNIGSNKNISNIEICKTLILIAKKKFSTKSKIKFVKDRPGHDFRYALDSKKIKKNLKWQPKTSFEIGIEKTFDWYLKNFEYYKNLSKKDIEKRLGLLT
jgi:dTDP-glucose 4,6-dehydratase